MRRNIFYVSNTQTTLFPHNTRTKFDQYIDVHSLNYIKQDDIEVAVKSIAFDNNNQSLHITPQPHFMIVQEVTAAEEHAYIQVMKTRLNKKE